MKFSDIEAKDWEQLQPYLDTCILPITGITGIEPPSEVTRRLEELRDLLDLVEIPYRGRIVTYPAVHFYNSEYGWKDYVDGICKQIKSSGFKYVVIMTCMENIVDLEFTESDCMINLQSKDRIASIIQNLWTCQETKI